MYLVIDVGNSSTYCALTDGHVLIRKWRFPTKSTITLKQLHEVNAEYLDNIAVEKVVIASVVPVINPILEVYCTEYLNSKTIWATIENIPVEVALPNPQEVGADRLMDAFAAHRLYQCNCIIVDFGTATTCELVSEKGVYHGGTISPGIDLSLKALHMGTAQLPEVEIAKPEHVIGQNTTEAIQSGMYWGYISLIEGLVGRIQHEYGPPCTIIATGGLAPLFAKNLGIVDDVDTDLTLKGLMFLGA